MSSAEQKLARPTRELIVDSFAGGGGASTGIEMALGRSPDIAINHDAVALAMHEVNHPDTTHLPHNIWKVDPEEACGGRPVGLLWASPDCKHFSKAKGAKPVEKRIRDLAWVVVRWARQVKPRVIILENVEEFATWGPLGVDGRPCPDRRGLTFRRWVGELRRLGYKVEHRELRACDYGAPTIRKRLFLIARRDGRPIVWPEATHGDPKSEAVREGRLSPWRTAAEIIDWSLPCPSIFLTKAEVKALWEQQRIRVIRPLKPNTMQRIAKGVFRYVINAAEPFIVPVTHSGDFRFNGVDAPLRTQTTAHRGEHALVTPFVTKFNNGCTGHPAGEPLHTITSAHSETHPGGYSPLGIVTPFLAPRYLEKEGQEPRTRSVELPTATQMPGGNEGVLVTPVLVGCGGRAGQSPPRSTDVPLRTLTAKADECLIAPHVMTMRNAQKPHNGADAPAHTVTAGGAGLALVAPLIVKNNFGDKPEYRADEPTRTIVAGGNHHMLVSAFLAQHNYLESGHDAREPISTIVGNSTSTQAVVSAGLVNLKGTDRRGAAIDAPVSAITAQGGHLAELRAFLIKYHGAGGQHADARRPMPTIDTRDRIGVVTVRGVEYQIVDIGMRMLTARERFNAQGFPPDYVIDLNVPRVDSNGALVMARITGDQQGRMVGNSVSPPVAAALVRANYQERAIAAPEPLAFALEAAE
jgi:DNA (cytosine-5)-methyltransferase 1